MKISTNDKKNGVNISNNEIHTAMIGAEKQNNAVTIINNKAEYWSEKAKGYSEDAQASADQAQAIVDAFETNVDDGIKRFNDNAIEKTNSFNSNATDKQALIDGKANEASESARKALNSQTLAKQSEDNALTSEKNAKTSENNASNYASNALISKTNAKTSENNAKASENNAKDYASNAKTSEDNALTYQNNAKTSETNAKASETECQRLVNSLENIYKYKGSVATYDKLPTTGNKVGDVWNVIENDVNYAWTGSEWDSLGGQSVDLTGYATKEELKSYLPLTGGELSGNLTAKYVTSTWLQTTSATKLNSTANKVAVIDPSGWIYYKSPTDIVTDGTTQTQQNAINSGITSNKVTTYDGYQAQIDNKQPKGNYVKTVNSKAPDSTGNIEVQAGGGLEIADIGTALFVDETQGKRRILNGQIVAINTNTQGFLDKLKVIKQNYPQLFTTEDNWQAEKALSQLGQCGKFVIDEVAGTIRIPAVVNIQGALDLSQNGLRVEAGLPNITGNVYNGISQGVMSVAGTGAFKGFKSGTSKNVPADSSRAYDLNDGFIFDASTENDIYGKSTTVQEEAIQYIYFIQIATGQETKADIKNELQLNNPFTFGMYQFTDCELNNLSWLRSNSQFNAKSLYVDFYTWLLQIQSGQLTVNGVSVKLNTESYTDYDYVLNTSDETFRLPIKVKGASGKAVVGNGITLGLTDGGLNYGLRGHSDSANIEFTGDTDYYGVEAGKDIAVHNYNVKNKTYGVTTDPTKSGIETSADGMYLYFYVGETIQNSNLINAGRLEEVKANNDLTNVNQLGKEFIISNCVFTLGNTERLAWNTVHQLQKDGYLLLGGYSSTASDDIKLQIGTQSDKLNNFYAHDSGYILTSTPLLLKGTYIKATGGHSYQSLDFIPAKGEI